MTDTPGGWCEPCRLATTVPELVCPLCGRLLRPVVIRTATFDESEPAQTHSRDIHPGRAHT